MFFTNVQDKPNASRTFNKKLETRKFPVFKEGLPFRSPELSRRAKEGFGLIEIILSVVLIIAIATGLFATSGTFLARRKSDLQSIAAKIASKDIENLRGTPFSSLPAPGTYSCAITDSDLSKLPASCGDRAIANYTGDTNIKQVTITIRWQENNIPKNLVMDTLIYANGL